MRLQIKYLGVCLLLALLRSFSKTQSLGEESAEVAFPEGLIVSFQKGNLDNKYVEEQNRETSVAARIFKS